MAAPVFALCILFTVCLDINTGSSLKVDINPQDTILGKTSTVTLICSLNSLEDSAAEISKIQISRKGGPPIAFIRSNSSITLLNPDEHKFISAGVVRKGRNNLRKSYLKITILNPNMDEIGLYICDVIYTTISGKIAEARASANLTVNKLLKSTGSIDKINGFFKKLSKNGSKFRNISKYTGTGLGNLDGLDKNTMNHEYTVTNLATKEEEVRTMNTLISRNTKLQRSRRDLDAERNNKLDILTETIKELIERVNKDGDEVKEIGEKQAAEETKKVEELMAKSGQKAKEIEFTVNKIKTFEKRIIEMENYVRRRLKMLEHRSKEVGSEHGGVRATPVTDLDNLEVGLTEIGKRLAELEEIVNKYFKKLDVLNRTSDETKGNDDGSDIISRLNSKPVTGFAVTNQEEVKDITSVVFPDVIFQDNPGFYDVKSGVFTAPVSGLYYVNLVIKVDCIGCHVEIDVMVSEAVVMRLQVGVMYDLDQGSASTVVRLKKNDRVTVVVSSMPGGVKLSDDRFCLFSGHLVSPLKDI